MIWIACHQNLVFISSPLSKWQALRIQLSLNHGVKWRVLTFQACNTFYYKFSFLFQVSKNWKETSQNTSQTSRITRQNLAVKHVTKWETTKKLTNFRVLERFLAVFTNFELATQRVLPIFGWWRFLHILASLSSFWKSEKSKNNYISLKASEWTNKQTNKYNYIYNVRFLPETPGKNMYDNTNLLYHPNIGKILFYLTIQFENSNLSARLARDEIFDSAFSWNFWTQLSAENFGLRFQLEASPNVSSVLTNVGMLTIATYSGLSF